MRLMGVLDWLESVLEFLLSSPDDPWKLNNCSDDVTVPLFIPAEEEVRICYWNKMISL